MGYRDGAFVEVANWTMGFLGIVSNVLAIAVPSGLLGAAGYFVAHFVAQLSLLESVLLGVLVAVVAYACFCFVWRRTSYRAYYYPRGKIKSRYVVLEKTINYNLENDKVLYSRVMTIHPSENNMTEVSDKYIWTGGQVANPAKGWSILEGAKAIEQERSVGIWQYIRIKFDSPLARYKPHTYGYQWPPLPKGNSRPFIGTSTEHPTKKLKMIVNLGSEYANQEYIVEEMQALEGAIMLGKYSGRFDLNGHAEWSPPKKPKRFRYYRMRWNWNTGTSPEGDPQIDEE